MRKLLSLLFLVPSLCFADRVVTLSSNVDSIYSVASWVGTTTSGTASLIDSNGAVIATAPVGQVGSFTGIAAVFPTMTSAVTAVKLQVSVQQTGKTFTGTWTASHTFTTPLTLSAGETPTVNYNPMNPSGATITANVVSPVVVAPPPTTTASPAGTTCPTSCPLIDPQGVTWNLVNHIVLVNGVDIHGVSDNYTDVSSIVMQANGTVRIISPRYGYFCMSSTGQYATC